MVNEIKAREEDIVQVNPKKIPLSRAVDWANERASIFMMCRMMERSGKAERMGTSCNDWDPRTIVNAFINGEPPFEGDTRLDLYGDWSRAAEELQGAPVPCDYTLIKEDGRLFAYTTYDRNYWYERYGHRPLRPREIVFKKVVEFV